jgi:hypothetical protein
MRPLRRRASRTSGACGGQGRTSRADQPQSRGTSVEQRIQRLPEGAYVTDGASLYRVAHIIAPADGDSMLLELEDCRTLEVILCSAAAMAGRHLDPVTPAGAG